MNLPSSLDSDLENNEYQEVHTLSKIIFLPPISQVFSLEKTRFDEKWNQNNLENKRREKLLESNIRRNNLYAEHLRNRSLIKEGNLFERFYYSVKDLFTQRKIELESKRGENSFLYFVN